MGGRGRRGERKREGELFRTGLHGAKRNRTRSNQLLCNKDEVGLISQSLNIDKFDIAYLCSLVPLAKKVFQKPKLSSNLIHHRA